MRTTKKQFEIFKKEFKRIQKLLGLTEWKVYFRHTELDGLFASINMDVEGMAATVAMTLRLDEDSKKEFSPKASGKHEALHLLHGKFAEYARRRYVTPDDIYEEQEALVRRLEKVII